MAADDDDLDRPPTPPSPKKALPRPFKAGDAAISKGESTTLRGLGESDLAQNVWNPLRRYQGSTLLQDRAIAQEGAADLASAKDASRKRVASRPVTKSLNGGRR